MSTTSPLHVGLFYVLTAPLHEPTAYRHTFLLTGLQCTLHVLEGY